MRGCCQYCCFFGLIFEFYLGFVDDDLGNSHSSVVIDFGSTILVVADAHAALN